MSDPNDPVHNVTTEKLNNQEAFVWSQISDAAMSKFGALYFPPPKKKVTPQSVKTSLFLTGVFVLKKKRKKGAHFPCITERSLSTHNSFVSSSALLNNRWRTAHANRKPRFVKKSHLWREYNFTSNWIGTWGQAFFFWWNRIGSQCVWGYLQLICWGLLFLADRCTSTTSLFQFLLLSSLEH